MNYIIEFLNDWWQDLPVLATFAAVFIGCCVRIGQIIHAYRSAPTLLELHIAHFNRGSKHGR